MEIKAYLAGEQGNEQVTDHFKVKEFACKDGMCDMVRKPAQQSKLFA